MRYRRRMPAEPARANADPSVLLPGHSLGLRAAPTRAVEKQTRDRRDGVLASLRRHRGEHAKGNTEKRLREPGHGKILANLPAGPAALEEPREGARQHAIELR